MPVNVPNPYTGKDEETCSVSFAAQQQMAAGVTSPQTEAEFNKSKQLGEWGVITAKLAKGEIPNGTKVLTYENASREVRGYLHVKGGNLHQAAYFKGNKLADEEVPLATGEQFIKATTLKTAIPQAVGASASPTPSSAVNAGSDSVGSMSHEDVAAMFVKIKDDLAKEKGLNIKGANPELDQLVYTKIGEATGYTGAEAKAKIDAYKADGNKLSALKKKVLVGTKKVPEGKPQPTKATPAAPLNVGKATNKPAQDPKPNGVPTVATPKVAEAIKIEILKEVAKEPAKHYTDEDVAAAYIIAKDQIVAASNGKFTLYTKSDELDLFIAIQVGLKTGGLSPLQQKQAIANYLASGKKLSALKKQLAKQGAFTPQADSLKKSGAAKTQEDKAKEIDAKAEAGYTPTPTPAVAGKKPDFGPQPKVGDYPTSAAWDKAYKEWKAAKEAASAPKIDTGKPAPKLVEKEAAEAGEIKHISEADSLAIYQGYKAKGHLSYLSSGPAANYDALVALQSQLKAQGKDYTLLQLIRVIDDQGAKKFQAENTKLLEKQTATWLTSPAGTAHIKANEAKIAKLAEDAKKAAEILEAANKLEANQPALPADSAIFQEMTPSKALAFQKIMLAKQPFRPGEKEGLRHYTGSAYTAMNRYLRGLSSSIGTASKRHIEKARAAFRPAPEPMLLRRGTSGRQFGLTDVNAVWGITGKTFEDKGFLSTSAAGRAAFGGEIAMEIEAPAGTPGMWVDNFSKNRGENEWILPPGTKMKVLNVRKQGYTFVVRLRVVTD